MLIAEIDKAALSSTESSKNLTQITTTRADLVEAATVVAQALGVQIVDDPLPSTSLNNINSSLSIIKENEKVNISNDSWILGNEIIYKWSDWCLIRNKNLLFIWCDVIAIEFR